MSPRVFRDLLVNRPTDRGQATVEFALTLPLIAMLLGLIAQMSVIAASHLDVVDEARRIGRDASLAEDPRAVVRASLPRNSTSQIEVWFDDSTVTVVVSRRIDTDLPIVGRFTPTIDVHSRLTMAREPRVHLP